MLTMPKWFLALKNVDQYHPIPTNKGLSGKMVPLINGVESLRHEIQTLVVGKSHF